MTRSSRIEATFARLHREGTTGLVTYTTAGDPDLPRSAAILKALDRAGADVLEAERPEWVASVRCFLAPGLADVPFFRAHYRLEWERPTAVRCRRGTDPTFVIYRYRP